MFSLRKNSAKDGTPYIGPITSATVKFLRILENCFILPATLQSHSSPLQFHIT